MAKTRLRNSDRERLLKWMTREKPKDKSFEKFIDGKLKVLIEHINPLVEQKYPKADMDVLNRYGLTRKDYCLKFKILESGQVYGVELNPYSEILTSKQLIFVKENISSVPSHGGCRNNVIFEGNDRVRDLYDALVDHVKSHKKKKKSSKEEI